MSKRDRKPRSILLSKRANVLYLEHVRVMQKDDRVIWINDRRGDVGPELEPYFNLPERNTVFVLLGKGSSVTDAAVRRLADAGVILGFCGSGGSPVFSMADLVFLSPQSEYRPTEYMQGWARIWFDEPARIAMARRFLHKRIEITEKSWHKDPDLKRRDIHVSDDMAGTFARSIESAPGTEKLLQSEAVWAKKLYRELAQGYKLSRFSRKEGQPQAESAEDRINSFIDHGNYIAYGYAAAVLYTLGISYAFPVLHGKTRRGGLVFDVADLIKDAFVLPLAFSMGHARKRQQDFRSALIDRCQDAQVLDLLFDFIEQESLNKPDNQ